MAVRALRRLLGALREAGHCVLFSSHVMQEVSALCDEVVVIAHGTVLASGTPAAIGTRTGTASLEEAFVALIAGGLSLRIERGAEEGERPITLAVAHGERAPNLLGFLRQYGVKVESVDYDAAAARAAVQAHGHDLVLAVSADFAAQLAAGRPAPMLLYADSSEPSASGTLARVTALLGQYASLLARLRMLARGVDPLVLSPLAVQDIDVSTPASRSVLALGTLSYLVLLTMLMGGMY